eukprot:11198278-Lingulodinium_polyedra.AAC.1
MKSKNYHPKREVQHALDNIEAKAAQHGRYLNAAETHTYVKNRLFVASTDWVVWLNEGIHF